MAQTFHITPASTFASLDPSGTGKVAFTITNASPKPLRAWPEIKPLGSTQREWLVIEGQAERSFSANEAHVFTVLINVPPGVTPGKYEFKLNVINADKADLDGCTEGPSVQFQVEAAVPTPPSNKWMWIAAAVLIVLVGAATTMLLMPSKEVKVAVVETTAPALETRAPALESKLLADVDGDLRSKGFEYEIVERRVTPDRRPPGGYIWSQDPKADQVLPKGAKLKLKIEASSVTMPDLIGMQIGESMAMLIEMRLFPKPPQVRIDPNNIDKVLDQSPKANVRVAVGTVPELWFGGATPALDPALAGYAEMWKDEAKVEEDLMKEVYKRELSQEPKEKARREGQLRRFNESAKF